MRGIMVLATVTAILGLGAVPATAQSRVFVSGSGSDSNPCTLFAPCRSFQVAHDAVSAGGEIVALDNAGYGTLLISKGITVTAIGIEASITSSNLTGYGIRINAGANDEVTIRGLTLIGGTASVDGIDINAARSVTIRDCSISGFASQGILVNPTANLDVELQDVTSVGNGGNGLAIFPSESGNIAMLVTDSSFSNNGDNGIQLNGESSTGTINATFNVAAAANDNRGILANSTSGQGQLVVMISDSKLVNNASGGLSGTSDAVQIFVDRTQISGNGANGWEAVAGAVVDSYSNNEVNGNFNDAFNSVTPVPPSGGSGSPKTCTVLGVSLSSTTFVAGSGAGMAVGTMSANTTGRCGSATWSMVSSGSDHWGANCNANSGTDFRASGSQMQLATTLVAGAYSNICYSATIPGAKGSPFVQATTIIGSLTAPPPPPPSVLTFVNLVNTSASTVNTVVSPFVGLQFKKGDVTLAPGQWPQFTRADNSAVCPYSYGMTRRWSDGSLKTMSVVFRCPGTIAANATLTVNVGNAGSQPSPSGSRTLSEQSAANIAMIGIGNGIFLSGTWVAALSDAITNGVCNVWIDGNAGKGWICDGDYKQSGAAHGQLRTRWYTFSLTDGSGSFGGIRYLSRTWQPYYDLDTPAKNMRDFASLVTCVGSASTTCNGGISTPVPFTYPPVNFTWTSASNYSAPGNNFYTGSPAGEPNIVPVTLSTTGSLPAGLSTGTIYFAGSSASGTGAITLSSGSFGGFAVSATGQCSGTCTMTPVLVVQHFGTIFDATPSATWNFAQAGGTLSADATLRHQKDAVYWHATQTLPPWNTSIATPNPTWNFSWDPVTIGPLQSQTSGTGSRSEIGPLPAQDALHFFTQDVNGEKIIRTIGLAGADFNLALRQCNPSGGVCTAFAPPNVGNPNIAYAGFGPNASATMIYNPAYGAQSRLPAGSLPPLTNGSTTWSSPDYAHLPETDYYAYLWTGEPQYLDILNEMANGAIYHMTPGPNFRNPSSPSQAYALTTALPPQTRDGAWSLRETVLAAAIDPDSSPDGIAERQYFSDSANASLAWLNTTIANTNSYYATNGYHAFRSFNLGLSTADNSVWQEAYLLMVADFASAVMESTDAVAFGVNKAKWYSHQLNTFGGWQIYGYYEIPVSVATASGNTPISSDLQWGSVLSATALGWTAGSPGTFSMTIDSNSGYVPMNGDKIIFGNVNTYGASPGPGGLPSLTPFCVDNLINTGGANYTFNVKNYPCGGSDLAVTDTNPAGPVDNTFIVAGDQPATGAAVGGAQEASYVSEVYGAGVWAQAVGVGSTINAIVTDSLNRLNAGGVYHCATTPEVEFCMQNSY